MNLENQPDLPHEQFRSADSGQAIPFRFLVSQEIVAKVAILPDNVSGLGLVFVVMAAEASAGPYFAIQVKVG